MRRLLCTCGNSHARNLPTAMGGLPSLEGATTHGSSKCSPTSCQNVPTCQLVPLLSALANRCIICKAVVCSAPPGKPAQEAQREQAGSVVGGGFENDVSLFRNGCCHGIWWINRSPSAKTLQAGLFAPRRSGQTTSTLSEAHPSSSANPFTHHPTP